MLLVVTCHAFDGFAQRSRGGQRSYKGYYPHHSTSYLLVSQILFQEQKR